LDRDAAAVSDRAAEASFRIENDAAVQPQRPPAADEVVLDVDVKEGRLDDRPHHPLIALQVEQDLLFEFSGELEEDTAAVGSEAGRDQRMVGSDDVGRASDGGANELRGQTLLP
jgi:hypothetical protein